MWWSTRSSLGLVAGRRWRRSWRTGAGEGSWVQTRVVAAPLYGWHTGTLGWGEGQGHWIDSMEHIVWSSMQLERVKS